MYLTCLSVFDPSGHLRSLWSRDVRKKSKRSQVASMLQDSSSLSSHSWIPRSTWVYHFHDRDRGRPEEQTLPGLQLHQASPPGCVFCLDQRISPHWNQKCISLRLEKHCIRYLFFKQQVKEQQEALQKSQYWGVWIDVITNFVSFGRTEEFLKAPRTVSRRRCKRSFLRPGEKVTGYGWLWNLFMECTQFVN